jgi:hypothetical protein
MALGLRGSNPIWLLDDLESNLFDDTFYMYVLENTIPYIPAIVYHYPDLTGPWTNPIQFLANGTLPTDIFFEPSVVYRLEFRQNNGIDAPSQNDPLIYEVNDYIAGTGGSGPIDTVAFASSNQITNPQFALVNFSSPFSLTSVTNPDPIEVGPGWFLELTGTGSVALNQVPLNNATKNPSNAPYALQITLTGWDAGGVFLRQRFQQNGMLWANKYVSSTITARLQGSPQEISAILIDSNGTTLTTVLNASNAVVNESFNEFSDFGQLPDTTNPDLPPAAYIEYRLALPNNVDIYVSSIQLVVQEVPFKPSFEQDSIDRQIDHTFHYYKPQLEYKPIPSYLVGWDFPMNPSQFFADGVCTFMGIGANKSAYIWDQTIAFQTLADALTISRDATTKGLKIGAASNTSFAIIQYIPANLVREILSQRNALQLKASVSSGTLSGTVSLWWTADATLPVVKPATYNSLVSSITAGVPTAGNGNWTQVLNDQHSSPSVPFTLTTTSSATNFIGYDGNAGAATATFMAVVIAFDTMPSTTTAVIDYCSLMGGDIATRPAPKTASEVLLQCQYYWQKSFIPNVTPADNVGIVNGESMGLQNVGAAVAGNGPLVRFPLPLRVNPTVANIVLYNPAVAGIAGRIWNHTVNNDYGVDTNINFVTQYGFNTTGTTPGGSAIGNIVIVNWTADARLGII